MIDYAGSACGSLCLAVAGSTGGVGASTVAVNLAYVMAAAAPDQVALLDWDAALGSVDWMLDLSPDYTVSDAVRDVSRLNFTTDQPRLLRREPGLWVLPRTAADEASEALPAAAVERLFDWLLARFPIVVVDLSKGYTTADWAVMQRADLTLLVTQGEGNSLRNAGRLAAAWEKLPRRPRTARQFRLVVNRSDDESALLPAAAEALLGRSFFASLPTDVQSATAAVRSGQPVCELFPKSRLAIALQVLARDLLKLLGQAAIFARPSVAPAAPTLRSLDASSASVPCRPSSPNDTWAA